MMRIFPAVFLLFSVTLAWGDAVEFDTLPKPMQVYPRILQSNTAIIPVTGTVVSNGYDDIVLTVYRDDVLYSSETQALSYASGEASFSLSAEIQAETHNYDFVVTLLSGGSPAEVVRVEDVVAGDVYLVNGQSNSVAQREGGGSANHNQDQFVRSYGTRSAIPATISGDHTWRMADGDLGHEAPGGVGQWSLRLGRRLRDAYGIPICIINNGRGAQKIGYFQRSDSSHMSLANNYGRMLYRAYHAGVTGSVRAILWYQGESDMGAGDTHENGFTNLYNDWVDNYRGFEQVYVFQVRVGCSVEKNDVDMRDRQRRFADYPHMKITALSTLGFDGHNGCHYTYNNGYEALGEEAFNILARDLYGSTNTNNIDPPNISHAFFSNAGRKEITLVMRNPTDTLTFDAGAEDDFLLEGNHVPVASGRIASNTVVLTLTSRCRDATGISYTGHAYAGPYIKNAGEIGLFSLYNIPIEEITWPEPLVANDTGVSNVMSTSALLQGELISTGQTPSEVTVYYGTDDGETVATNWQYSASLGEQSQGALAYQASGLKYGTTYYYRYYAVNAASDTWADTAVIFTTKPAVAIHNDTGATDISTTSAVFNTELTYAEQPTDIYFYWGLSDGQTDPNAWNHAIILNVPTTGVYSASVPGLTKDTRYYYRCYGTNSIGEGWSDATAYFNTENSFEEWLYRMKVTFSGYNGTEALTNFPVLIRFGKGIPGFDYSLFDSAEGTDLRFSDADGHELAYEIDTWETNGTSYAWVKVRRLSNPQAYLYAFMGKDNVKVPYYSTNGTVWSEGYAGVWHLSNSDPLNSVDGFYAAGSGNTNAPGVIGGGQLFTAADQVNAGDIDVSPSFTVEAWLKDSMAPPSTKNIANKPSSFKMSHVNSDSVYLSITGSNRFEQIGSGGITGWIGWHYLAGTWDGINGNCTIIKDGNTVYTVSRNKNPVKVNSNDLLLGDDCNAVLDEIRISSIARSEDWLKASWLCQMAPTAFGSYSPVEVIPEPGMVFTGIVILLGLARRVRQV
jgi:hypothetical protein